MNKFGEHRGGGCKIFYKLEGGLKCFFTHSMGP